MHSGACTDRHTHACTDRHTHACTDTLMHAQTLRQTHSCMHRQTHSCMHRQTHSCMHTCTLYYLVIIKNKYVILSSLRGVGIAQWLERRTRDWKVAGSNPCWNGGRIFFSRVNFLCWLLFRYPFHPRVTAVARKKSRSFCQKCRWQVTAKHAYTLRMWLLLNHASALVTTCP